MSIATDAAELRDIAVQAGQAGAQAALKYFRRPEVQVEWKSDESPVTIADREAEAAIRAVIQQERPDDAWLGEETGADDREADFRWIVDPIDGTRNFVRGVPLWATLVACEDAQGVCAAAVLIPGLNEVFEAFRGGGSRCNGQAIAVSAVSTPAESLWCYETPGWFRDNGLGAVFDRLCTDTQLQRGLCDAYGHMLVASGRAELVIEPELSIWDVAATSLVVTEAGGRFTDLDGADSIASGNAVVSNGHVHDYALGLLAQLKSA